jgi:hypothetical protein
MTYSPPEDRPGWRTAPSDGTSSHDALPPQTPEGGGWRAALLAAVGGVVALVVVAGVMLAASGGGGDDGGGDGGEDGADVGGALATATTAPPNAGSVSDDTAPTTEAAPEGPPAGADLPPATIPSEASAPTTIPGSEPSSVPVDIFSGGEAPLFGHLVVDLEPGGYQDFAVHLRDDQELQLLSLADDGTKTQIEVFAPDGSSEGWWEGGEPGVVNGLEWYLSDEPLPATGTYVVRVIHTGGSDERFVLGFFGTA